MKGKIYTVATLLEYDYYECNWFKEKFQSRESDTDWTRPVFAKSEEEAILKYKDRYDYDALRPILWSGTYNNLKKTVAVISEKNTYTIDGLKKYLNSQDFLEYCRQELLSVEEIIK